MAHAFKVAALGSPSDKILICFCHLRWSFVTQRPQHLMKRFARDRTVIYVEEPVWTDEPSSMNLQYTPSGVIVAIPTLCRDVTGPAIHEVQAEFLNQLLVEFKASSTLLWYYTPLALAFSDHIAADKIVYDCMDELSAFQGAPPELIHMEKQLLSKANIVFTGGHSLYEAKKLHHRHVHAFPSSVDVAHFRKARRSPVEPHDQQDIPHPRIGHYAVLDERLDLALVAAIADARPDWHLILIGPVVKIDPSDLPQRHNIHYLGMKPYEQLPAYLGGWDVAFMPFALNNATRFISPTKTPEYLAAGLPVISTPITDVVSLYGDAGLVEIASTAPEFVSHISRLMERPDEAKDKMRKADRLLAEMSWERTWSQMSELLA